jgi:hypothetical protein
VISQDREHIMVAMMDALVRTVACGLTEDERLDGDWYGIRGHGCAEIDIVEVAQHTPSIARISLDQKPLARIARVSGRYRHRA